MITRKVIMVKGGKLKVELFCPSCGWRTMAIERIFGKADFLCPRCGKHRLSEFGTHREVSDD